MSNLLSGSLTVKIHFGGLAWANRTTPLSSMKCPTCGSTDIDNDESAGQMVCVSCGEVVEENTIVNQVEFVESGDRSMILGQFVSATSSRAFNSSSRSRNRYGNSRESRDATLAMARRNIAQVASSLRLPNIYIDKAYETLSACFAEKFYLRSSPNARGGDVLIHYLSSGEIAALVDRLQ